MGVCCDSNVGRPHGWKRRSAFDPLLVSPGRTLGQDGRAVHPPLLSHGSSVPVRCPPGLQAASAGLSGHLAPVRAVDTGFLVNLAADSSPLTYTGLDVSWGIASRAPLAHLMGPMPSSPPNDHAPISTPVTDTAASQPADPDPSPCGLPEPELPELNPADTVDGPDADAARVDAIPNPTQVFGLGLAGPTTLPAPLVNALEGFLPKAPHPIFPRARRLYYDKYPLEGHPDVLAAAPLASRFRTFVLRETVNDAEPGTAAPSSLLQRVNEDLLGRIQVHELAIVHWKCSLIDLEEAITYVRLQWQVWNGVLEMMPDTWFRKGGAWARLILPGADPGAPEALPETSA